MRRPVYFHRSTRGESDVRTFVRALPRKHCLKRLDYMRRVRERGAHLPRNIVAHVEGELWEMRPEYGGTEYRFLFFVHESGRIGVVLALKKKRQPLERRVIDRAHRLVTEMRAGWQEVR